MTVFEATSVAGLFAGPIFATILTLAAQERTRRWIARQNFVANLLSVHDDPSDPAFSLLIRRIPLEFSKNRAVVSAWANWKDHLTVDVSANAGEVEKRERLYARLLKEITKAAGWKLDESDIKNIAYRSEGLNMRIMQQIELQSSNLKYLERIAVALEKAAPSADGNDNAQTH